MSEFSVTHSTFVIEKEYSATLERVFGAFADPAQKRRWFAEGEGFIVDAYGLDFRVGGREHGSFRMAEGTPLPDGTVIHNETRYQDIVANQRIVFVYTMAMGQRVFSSSQTTVEFLPKGQGTRLVYTEQAAFFENADGAELRENGCRQLLEALARELTLE
jgi:uncharacterized protein YndB with AHSA1/START domain